MQGRDDIARLGDATLASVIAQVPEAAEARRTLIRITSGTSGKAPIMLATGFAVQAPRK